MTIKLFQFPSVWGVPNASPYCMKLETYLRMAQIPYQFIKTYDPRKAPVGKLPYIEDDGKKYVDSGLIIDYLKKTYGDPLDANLTAAQKAQALAWQRLMEEHLYWVLFYSRWGDKQNWPITKNIFFGKLPLLKRTIASTIVRKKMLAELHGQGLGRLSQEQIYQLGLEDLQALQTNLTDKLFMLGETPSSLDACAYAFIANFLYPPTDSPLDQYARKQPIFTDYCERMKARYYTM